MRSISFILIALMVTSCGGFKFFENTSEKERKIASLVMEQLVEEEAQTFSDEIDERLFALHSYQILAQANLLTFDELLVDSTLREMYKHSSYLNLMAIRTQMDEIENEFMELWSSLENKKTKSAIQKKGLVIARLKHFEKQSTLAQMSVQNIKAFTGDSLDMEVNVSEKEIRKEYKRLEAFKEFQIYEKNIEHLSHLMDASPSTGEKPFAPSIGEQGHLTGEEFPSKVWAISFNDGPTDSTPKILHNLLKQNLKATFFQTSVAVKKHKVITKSLMARGMDIGSHSMTHQSLITVGALTLEKEIGSATQEIEKELKTDIKFIRLPYGVGATVPNLRQKIADHGLIHVKYTIDSLDWIVQSPDRIIKRTKALMKKSPKDSGIILFHDSKVRTVTASLEIMKELTKEGRRTCTIHEIIQEMNEGVETVCPKF